MPRTTLVLKVTVSSSTEEILQLMRMIKRHDGSVPAIKHAHELATVVAAEPLDDDVTIDVELTEEA